jgi:DNA mismatch repair protein MutS
VTTVCRDDAVPRKSDTIRGAAFPGLLSPDGAGYRDDERRVDEQTLRDLHLDHIVDAITAGAEDPGRLTTLLYRPLRDVDSIRYRQEVFQDLDKPAVNDALRRFAAGLRQVRTQLARLPGLPYHYQQEGWLLDAAVTYCHSVGALAEDLRDAPVTSPALTAWRRWLSEYAGSEAFSNLVAASEARRADLDAITYCVRIRGLKIQVARYSGEPDYSAQIADVFDRFRQGSVKDYRAPYRGWPGLNHLSAQILERVARLFGEQFQALDHYCRRYRGFLDETVCRFAEELEFFLAYLDYIAPLRAAGLDLCYPEVTVTSKAVHAVDTYDVALAHKLLTHGDAVVLNDVKLKDDERVLVVSGPNQGGKTTFARTIGQLHHLGAVGCPVAGTSARLYLFDQLLTHFGRQEDLADLSGKLEDDLIRVSRMFRYATDRSLLIFNEVFTSTTLADARFLGEKLMRKVVGLDCMCVYVTFVDELASFAHSVASMVSTVTPEDPAVRTFKVVRCPADGRAYALSLAERHRLTYDDLRRRVHQ